MSEPPTKALVLKTLAEGDLDESGTLNEIEFQAFAEKWFEKRGYWFIIRSLLTALTSMVILPQSATMLQKSIPHAHRIPSFLFKVVFGVGKSIL